MVRLRVGRPPKRHDGVAYIFVECSPILKKNLGHLGEIFVQAFDERRGGQSFGEGGEPANISKHDGERLFLTAQTQKFGPLQQLADQAGRDVLLESAADFLLFPFFKERTITNDARISDNQSRRRREHRDPDPVRLEKVVGQPQENSQKAKDDGRRPCRTNRAQQHARHHAEED